MTAEEKMTRLLLGASTDLRKIYNQLVSELAKATAQSIEAVTPGEFYNIARHCTPAQRKRVDALLQEYHDMLLALVRQGVTHAVAQSATLTAQLFRGYVQLTGEQTERWRKQAARSFINSRMRRDGGLSLSDRVWNYTEQTKAEFELAVSQAVEKGIAAGMDAERLGRQVRQYLNNPDMMYRRYHRKKVMADGTKRDIVEWRRRRVGPDGKVHFVREDLARVGTGVYRSARQNALRLVITETNMAYNAANADRWSQQPFVLGIRIRLSGNHPEPDICDELQGDYPRTFQWRGWHPRCRCSQSPIMMDRESDEWKRLRSLPKSEWGAYQSPNLITSTPRAFNEWVSSHKDKLQKARDRGKLPYFVRDNQKAVGQLLGWKEQAQKPAAEQPPTIGTGKASARRERAMELIKGSPIDVPESRLNNAAKSKNELYKFEKEHRMCKVAALNGHDVKMLEEEPGVSSCDILLDGKRADLKSINKASNIHRHAKKAIHKQGAELIVFEFSQWGDNFQKEINILMHKGIHGYYCIKGSDKLHQF